MAVRREVLGDAHVDATMERASTFTSTFQNLITRYAWGEIWTRPGLDRRTRSAITLTALAANRHWGEFAMHVRAARRNGLTADEIGEVLLQLGHLPRRAHRQPRLRDRRAGDRPVRQGRAEHVTDAYRLRRGAHAVRPVRRRPGRAAARRSGRAGRQQHRRRAPGARTPARDRRGGVRQRQRRRGGEPQRRPDGHAARRAATSSSRHHRQPALRLEPGRRDHRAPGRSPPARPT